MIDYLLKLLAAHKQGDPVGITSICSANNFVVSAALEYARKRNSLVCIESTGRQVNQFGGYAGMQPEQFAKYVRSISEAMRLDCDKVVLGGDHLGPDAWRFENSDVAMAKAKDLIRNCVYAGYRKLHLDTSMPCQDDMQNGRTQLSIKTIADRTASLCEIAEQAAKAHTGNKVQLVYVVGAEVPTPGGMLESRSDEIRVSSAKDVEDTISIMHRAFVERGLESAWDRCLALVVETGTSFGPETVCDYDSKKTKDLKLLIEGEENMVFEAHSTDFQTRQSLSNMVYDHFAILKVGPWLTFTTREALYALAYIEREWLAERRGVTLSRLPELMQELMDADSKHWQEHYQGDKAYLRYISAYGFSDRIRYYWSDRRCSEAIERLFENLTKYGIPLPLLSQYMPTLYEAVREGRIQCIPSRLVYGRIEEILDKYAKACGNYATVSS
ncbi:MAG: class II D-tagatose-bisphosphate aldolase, non-catalytic subunit [Pseudomonadota bacterium]